MKKIYVIVIHILAIITVSLNIYQYNNHQAKSIINSTKNNNSNLLSIMMENDQGEYEESNKNEFPEEGYLLDTKRSGCENGGTLEYQDHNVYVKASSSERCYVYFAKDTILNECELGYANASSGVCTILKTYGKDQTLYYHDGKADYDGMENSNLEAEDDSYRYSGANPNNYVCFGGDCSNNPNDPNYKNLYRIIGLFKNEDNGQYEMKIIKADGTTKEDLGENDAYSSNYGGYEEYYRGKIYNKLAYYFYNNSDKEHMTVENNTNVNMWKESNLNTKNLNGTYYNSLNSTYQKMISNHKWYVGGYGNPFTNSKTIYEQELGKTRLSENSQNCYTQGNPNEARYCNQTNDLIYQANVGLMYVSDYMYGALPKYWSESSYNYQNEEIKTNNWLYVGIGEWTISRLSLYGIHVIVVYAPGFANDNSGVFGVLNARPTLYLNSDVKIISGKGLDSEPYKLA